MATSRLAAHRRESAGLYIAGSDTRHAGAHQARLGRLRRLAPCIYVDAALDEQSVEKLVRAHACRIAARLFPGSWLFGPSALRAHRSQDPVADGVLLLAGTEATQCSLPGLDLQVRYLRRECRAVVDAVTSDPLGDLRVRASCVEHALLDTARTDRQFALDYLAGDGDTTCWQVRSRLWETAQKLNARAALDSLMRAAEAEPLLATAVRVGLPAIHAQRCVGIFWHGHPVADLLQRDRGFEVQLHTGLRDDNPAKNFLRGRHSCSRDFAPPAIEHLCTPGLYTDPVRRRQEARLTLERVFRGSSPARLLGGLSIGRTTTSSESDRHINGQDPLVTHSSSSTFQGRLIHNWVSGRRRFEALETMFMRGLPVDPRGGAWIPVNLDEEGGVRVATDRPWTHSLLIPGLPGFSVELHVLSGALLKAIGLPVPETRLLPLGDGQTCAIAARPDMGSSGPSVLPAVESLAAMASGARTRLGGAQGHDRPSIFRMASLHGGPRVVAHALAIAATGYVLGSRSPDFRDALVLSRVGEAGVDRSLLAPTGMSIDANTLSVSRELNLREFASRVATAIGGSTEQCLKDTVGVVTKLSTALDASTELARELPAQWKLIRDALMLAHTSIGKHLPEQSIDDRERTRSGTPRAQRTASVRVGG